MENDDLRRYLADNFPGTDLMAANGDLFCVYDPDRDLPDERRMPWATLVTSDAYDAASDLDRAGVYRLNIGLPKAEFQKLFPAETETEMGTETGTRHDLTALDVVMPHPVYGSQHWVCVLNPDSTWPAVRGLLDRAHALAVRKFANAAARRRSGR